MSYKTILVHSADPRRWAGLLAVGVVLARKFEAHLVALSILPPVIVDPALTPGGLVTIIDSHRKAYEKDRARMKAMFEQAVRESHISGEWMVDDAERGSVWSRVLNYGRSADLIVASQADPTWSYSVMMEAPAELALHSGRPVLILPNQGDHTGLGKRILVAWNGRRESARAAFDAIPFLKQAEKVSLVWVNPGEDDTAQDVPAGDLAATLARHGVKSEASAMDRSVQPVGEALLARGRSIHTDLLVMGCYGHSRLRELILGGATRYILKEMRVPVLMAH